MNREALAAFKQFIRLVERAEADEESRVQLAIQQRSGVAVNTAELARVKRRADASNALVLDSMRRLWPQEAERAAIADVVRTSGSEELWRRMDS
jgi:hypothetical protein